LKARKDNEALVIFEKVLASRPDNLDALWGKAEVKRRAHKYKEAQVLLSEILKQNPEHLSSLISLAYIRYKDDKLNEALSLINRAINASSLDKENAALAYMMLGTINSRRTEKGWFFSKIRYGTQIKCYFLKAKELAPHLPEVHLGLGTFYLKAPAIAGGNLDRAVQELEAAVRIAPDFATANARLAQAYKKKGELEKYNFYLLKAKELDPENEALKELQ
jgi:tetratricopeptide (TPR) repeat protein